MIQVRASNTAILLNQSPDKAATLSPHDEVCSFGKGSWKLVKGTDAAPENSLEFKVTSSDDLVVLDNVVATLGAIMEKQWRSKPDQKINYHEIARDTADPLKFTINQTHRVCFVLTESPTEVTKHNIASKISFDKWKESKAVRVLFHMKVGAKDMRAINHCSSWCKWGLGDRAQIGPWGLGDGAWVMGPGCKSPILISR